MTSRILRIVVIDIEAEWLVPVTASISWVDYQLVLKLTSSRTRHGVQEFLRRNNIPVTEFVRINSRSKRITRSIYKRI